MHENQMKHVAIVIFKGFQALDATGPMEVFVEANRVLPPEDHYAVTLLAPEAGPVRASNGSQFSADAALSESRDSYDLALAAGGPELSTTPPAPAIVAWFRAIAPRCRRYGSICSGAFALGHAGLLNGKRATTHWHHIENLLEQFPETIVESDRLHIRDGSLITSAGAAAGIDLALALVAEDHGPEIAHSIAKRLVFFSQRGFCPTQASAFSPAALEHQSPIAKVQAYVMTNIRNKINAADLADVAGMSTRHFARVFLAKTGTTPHEFIERIRVDMACRLLSADSSPLKSIAWACGFGTADNMRSVFTKRFNLTPLQYRENAQLERA